MLLLPLIVSVNTAHKCVCHHSQLRKYRCSCENIKCYKLCSVRTAQHSKSYTASDVYDICTCTKLEKVPHWEELQCWPGTNRTSVLSALTGVEHGLTCQGKQCNFREYPLHAPPLFCHVAQAATSTSDCTAGTNYNHNPSPRDHLEQGCNWSLLLLSSGPYAHISFIRTQENKAEKLMPPRSHSNKEDLVKFIFWDSFCCWKSSLRGRTYTQRGRSNEGRTALIQMMKEGLTEQPWIILGGEWQPRDTIMLLVKQWGHIRTYFYLGLRMPISIGTDRNCLKNPKLCDLPLKYSCLPATGPESYHSKYAPVYAHHSP